MLSASFVRFHRYARISHPMPRSRSFGVRWGTRTRHGRGGTSGRDSWTHGALQHRSACLLTAHRPVNGVREVREAAEQRADGAGHAHAAHAHRSAPHLVLRASLRALLRRCRGGHGGKDISMTRTSIDKPSRQKHAQDHGACFGRSRSRPFSRGFAGSEPPIRLFLYEAIIP